MNELQQVLLVFAVVVIAGLYFLSRSRQNTTKTNASQSRQENHSETPNKETAVRMPTHTSVKSETASEALNNLGSPHIPLSESTEKRITESRHFPNEGMPVENDSLPKNHHEEINQNQGVLSFGEEFDLPHDIHNSQVADPQSDPQETIEAPVVQSVVETEIIEQKQQNSTEQKVGPKHHVLIVDDPGMTGELDDSSAPSDYVKCSFGIPDEELTTKKFKASTSKEPEVYVLLVMSTAQEFKMTEVNQALLGVGLTYCNQQGIFVKNDNMGNAFIKVANMLEPGTFPQENMQSYLTPGVAMILELPTTVRAPAAMHDLIIMARKISQRLHGRLYNMERHLIKESDLQSMRDAALDYESEPIA